MAYTRHTRSTLSCDEIKLKIGVPTRYRDHLLDRPLTQRSAAKVGVDNDACGVDDFAQIGRLRFGQPRSQRRYQILGCRSFLTAANRCARAIQNPTRKLSQPWI